ncbi:sugar phosphate isomerase/epimerase family protein [Azospirillum thermophilum]|uniref:Sugar phosphate isomerase/epimerase n=1 Tax=Azospirillum thermophilum TaxID=2202148 RepID=A0A2S2D0F4_9PROT|nr:TIM barrel protein [Azospirillum thermophilum]AWK90239.1 sugar phosphate isomerase/epimerase [Azospirillum thermophilum]
MTTDDMTTDEAPGGRAVIGIMQGRMLPPFEGRFQAFPAGQWEREFPLAADAGLDCIEWIYEVPNEHANPLGSEAGIMAIRRCVKETGVTVRSICADYYMVRRLVAPDGTVDKDALAHLTGLIGRARMVGARHIVLPFVDSSRLATPKEVAGAAAALTTAAPAAADAGIELHLETDLPPAAFAGLLERIGHPMVRANYDIGNSASLGYEPAEELRALAPWLGSIHVKDRLHGGGTVPLGTGSADFPTCFRGFRAAGYDRHYILQAARGEAGDEVAWARANRRFVETRLAEAAAEA